eukprot:8648718-Ditylum_brightwellii.AAC.1
MEEMVKHASQHNMERMCYYTSQHVSLTVMFCITIMKRMVKNTSQHNMERMCEHASQHGRIAIYQ